MLITSPVTDKKTRRADALARRQGLAAALDDAAGRAFASLLLEHVSGCGAIAAYWPMRDEIDVKPVLQVLAADGKDILLPIVEDKNAPLIFRRWRPGNGLERSSFGVEEPSADQPEGLPDCLIVPMLAFDRDGYRLGYGGGFYDRTIAALREAGPCLTVGAAYAGQLMDYLPRESHDQPLDLIVTEKGVMNFQIGRT
ncbi:MAG: 5-formyltetrahydrofolate cyclo-ligase [Rhodospirillaceae bacterium]